MSAVIDLTGASSDEEEDLKPNIQGIRRRDNELTKLAGSDRKSNAAGMSSNVGGGMVRFTPERMNGGVTPSQSVASGSGLTRLTPQGTQASSSRLPLPSSASDQENMPTQSLRADVGPGAPKGFGSKPMTVGVVRKIENMSEEELSSSSRYSTWGEPLPPEPPESPHSQPPKKLPSPPGVNQVYRGPRANFNSQGSSAPNSSGVCRNFWRAGDYEAHQITRNAARGAMDHVRVHPKFLHSNATSHKWALGAVAELLDNAVDEVQNGATFVNIDVIVNPRDGSPVLLVQDDGGGMSPDCMRQCMSLGYSAKNTLTTIGQYGNGFKTSTMRLGADVIVFSRCNKESTLSIGLLSYTFLRKTGMEDVVVPMVDYNVLADKLVQDELPRKMIRTTHADWVANLDILIQWSPFSSESELLGQFADIGLHGTKVIVYNLWLNDDGLLELDFNSDEQDIQLRGRVKTDSSKPVQHQLAENHIANRYHHSLRVYTSILYLKMPRGFQIILRGKPVEHHLIASDLKFCEHIVYKPQIGNPQPGGPRVQETSVITVIGFTKEAPLVNVHGFNVYHKNRLIMPFWKVWHDNSSRGRGVVGVLEANFVEPAHDKQDFERTAVLLRLETRLKGMTVEYWNLHCHLIGYQPNTKAGRARKQAAAQAEALLLPSPLASIAPGPSVVGEGSGAPNSMPPVVGYGSAAGDGPIVKAEPVDGPSLSSERSGSGASAGSKRPRVEISENALVVQQNAEDVATLELVRENSELKARCQFFETKAQAESERRQEAEGLVKHLKSRLAELEKKMSDNGSNGGGPAADGMELDNNESDRRIRTSETLHANGLPKVLERVAKIEEE